MKNKNRINSRFHYSDLMTKTNGLTHCFTSKTYTLQSGDINPDFDLSRSQSLVKQHIKNNHRILALNFNFQLESLITVNQVHGDIIYHVKNNIKGKDNWNGIVEADAIITDNSNIIIGVRTADCVPILLFDPVSKAFAAIHAGWKGTYLGLPSKTVREMKNKFNSKPENIIAAIGPAIGSCCYEVDQELANKFNIFTNSKKCYLDLAGINKKNLIDNKLKKENIDLINKCTKCNHKLFFSYRKQGSTSGRQMAVINYRN